MSEIDKAIEYFYKQMELGIIKSDYQQEVFEKAIQALEEKKQREQGCEDCIKRIAYYNCVEVQDDDDETVFSDYYERVDINFCPKCGKPYKEANDE